MVKRCSLSVCKKSKQEDSVSLHAFPPGRHRTKWIELLVLQNGVKWNFTEHSRVCSEHFTEKDFNDSYVTKKRLGLQNLKPMLKPDAIPRFADPQTETQSQTQDDDIEESNTFEIISESTLYFLPAAVTSPQPSCSASSLTAVIPSPPASPSMPVVHTSVLPSCITATVTFSMATLDTSTSSTMSHAVRISHAVGDTCGHKPKVKEQPPVAVEKPKFAENPSDQSCPKKKMTTKGTQTKKKKHNIQYSYRSQSTQCDITTPGSTLQTNTPTCTTFVTPMPMCSTPKKMKMTTSDTDTPNTSFGSQITFKSLRDDLTYIPSDGELEESVCSEGEKKDPADEVKYIVFQDHLLSLFTICRECYSSTHARISKTMGTFVAVTQECSCGWTWTWNSQPFVGNVPAGNIVISASILFSGAIVTKALRFLEHANIQSISLNTYMNHQQAYLIPSVERVWHRQQQAMFSVLRRRDPNISVGGDGRADSPGHSAKYGSYTFIHLDSGKVLDVQLVQSNEVNGSTNMEKEGLIKAVQFLKEQGLSISQIVTDRHLQIQKWIRENLSGAQHYYDVWHVAKGTKKKLMAIAKTKGCEDVGEWVRSISNHMYWVAASTPDGDPDLMMSKWKSVANHIQNIHEGHEGKYSACSNGEIPIRKWLKPSTDASCKVEKLVTDTRLCNAVRKLSPLHQTSELEAFHSLINQFAPKMVAFSYYGLMTRLKIAALHFNENVSREDAITKAGVLRHTTVFPKHKKGEATVRVRKERQTFKYVQTLLGEVCQVAETPMKIAKKEATPKVAAPPPMCSKYVRPDKQMALRALTSRFRKTAKLNLE